MKRVQEDKDWSLMCPDESPGLHDCWGEEFEELYQRWVYASLWCICVRVRNLPAVDCLGTKLRVDIVLRSKHRSSGLRY